MIVRKIVAQGLNGEQSMAESLREAVAEINFNRLDVAVAYATIAGIRSLSDSIGGLPEQTRWIVGLDDAITQPEALDELKNLPHCTLLLASLNDEGRRFHPKLYCLWNSDDPSVCLLALGSANMTLHGLNKNGEVDVLLSSECAEDAASLKSAWERIAALGRDYLEWDLVDYAASHKKARRARRSMAKLGLPVDPELIEEVDQVPPFNGDPRFATVAWTEGATPSAGGRDLEFPRKIMPFFKLSKSPTNKRFRMADGSVHVLTFTMRPDNQMWRLLFSRDAIQAGIGRDSLRPVGGGNRSDLAIVFERSTRSADFDVKLVVIGSAEHTRIMNKAKATGSLEKTRDPGGRYFGCY